MKRVSGDDRKELDAITERLRSAESDLELAIDRYNDVVREEFDLVRQAITSYNEAIESVRDLRDRISEQIADYMANRSERWHESDRGNAYEAWRQSFDDITLDDVEIETPDGLEMIDDLRSETLEADWQDEPEI